jgi:hypothetical protein
MDWLSVEKTNSVSLEITGACEKSYLCDVSARENLLYNLNSNNVKENIMFVVHIILY